MSNLEVNILTAEELQEVCAEWKRRLRLDAWDIVINLYRQREFFSEEECVGENTYDLRKCESVIRIIDPLDYPTNTRFPLDMEVVVVHELLHLLFATFEPEEKTLSHDMWEQTIERLAKALVCTKREKKGDTSR